MVEPRSELKEADYIQTILIVDSDRQTGDLLTGLLEGEGFNVSRVSSGADTLSFCEQTCSLDLVLMTDSLPDMNSLEVCRQLVSCVDDLAVFLLTDHPADNDLIDQLFEAGGIDTFSKPIHARLLLHRIKQTLDARKSHFLTQMRERIQTVSELAEVYLYEVSFPPNDDPSILWSVRGTKAVTGYEREEVDVVRWLQLVHPDDMEVARRHREVLLSGRPHTAEFRICTKDGQIRWLRDHGYPIAAQSDEQAGHVCGAAQDITWCKLNEEEFHQQKEELEARNEELDAFAYSVAHDLKNPISSMMGFASLVQKYYDRMGDEAILEYLALIIDEGYHLKEMINSLLVLAGVSKMKDIELEELDMPIIVSSVQRRLTTMIGDSGAKIITPANWPRACGYAPWVEEIWMNYISNAIKYGGRPPVIELDADHSLEGIVRFWVRDNGNGLTAEEQQNVFTLFTRLNQVKVEGHGLGLSVVQRIVRRLGGVVDVQSEIGAGSTFSFTLSAVE